MRELFVDIRELLSRPLTATEIFYYASLIHLVFVHIHPFADGNGRTGRLLEKWFLATTLGPDLWKIASEEYYLAHRSEYYQNINLGVNYYELNYHLSLPFLSMLIESV
jgi:Fic family protein